MANPYIGEIRLFAGNYAPNGWSFCHGQLLPISEYEALFILIGTTYGGDGQTTFALPDMRARIPVHQGPGFVVGQLGGAERVTLTAQQIPAHRHVHNASSSLASSTGTPAGFVADAGTTLLYGSDAPSASLAPGFVAAAGGSQSHDNMAPYLGLNYIISLFGIFPSPT